MNAFENNALSKFCFSLPSVMPGNRCNLSTVSDIFAIPVDQHFFKCAGSKS